MCVLRGLRLNKKVLLQEVLFFWQDVSRQTSAPVFC